MASSYSCPLFDIPVRRGLNGLRDFCNEIGNLDGLDYQNMYEQYKCLVKSIESTYPKPWPATVRIPRQFVSQPQPSSTTATRAPVDAPNTHSYEAPDPPASIGTQYLDPPRPATVSVAQNQGSSVRRPQPNQATIPAMESVAKTSTTIAHLGSQRPSNSVSGGFSQRLEHLDIFGECISVRMQELLKGSVEDRTSRTNAGAIGEGRPWPN